MRRLFFVVTMILGCARAEAAEIVLVTPETPEHPALILVKGKFLKEETNKDILQFDAIAGSLHHPAYVLLEGTGGLSWTAVQLGRTINRHGYSTIVADDTKCSSSCALVWLAGKSRYMGTRALIGFHASMDIKTKEPSAVGNAIVGAYFYEIGIRDYRNIIYLTQTPPTSIMWVTTAELLPRGIFVNYFDLSHDRWSWLRTALEQARAISAVASENPKP